MPSPLNLNTITQYNNVPIEVGYGLDRASPAGKAPAGSLYDCLNFEIVEGNLQVIPGNIGMGRLKYNGTYNVYFLVGDSTAGDYTLTGSISDGEVVKWYPDSTSMNAQQGEGIWFEDTSPSLRYVGIIHTSGEEPTGQSHFIGATSGATITVDDDDYRFKLPDPTFSNLTVDILANGMTLQTETGSVNSVWNEFRPSPLQTNEDDSAISHIFQCNDNLYAVCDFPVVGYYDGANRPNIGDKVHIDYPNASGPIGYVAHVEEMQGDWEDGDQGGWLYLYPQSDGTLSPTVWDNIVGYNQVTIYNLTQSNTLGTTPPQTGTNDVKVHKYHGQVWKLDTATQLNTGWSWVHPGYSVRFGNDDTTVDQTAPNTEIAPLFVSDGVSTLADTGQLGFNTPTEEPASGGTLSAWSNLTNLVSDDAAYATSTPLAGDATRKLNFTLAASTAIPDTAKITGIEVTFEAFAAATDVVYCSVAQLRNDAAGARDDGFNRVWDVSENRGRSIEDPLTASPTVFTIGGDLDLWGLEEIPIADWNNQDIELDLQFANTDASSRLVSVDYVWIKVYYTVNAKDVYFVRDGSDITNGQIFAYQVHDGDWSTEDAKGWLSFENIDDPDLVLAGDAIWTGTGGTGEFIGNVRSLQMNLLPSWDEMRLAGTRSQTAISSLASEDGEETAYCVNGVGPAWALDANDRIRMIRTPVSPEKDKPRFVEEHRNHLVLGLKEHFIVSAINSPDVMTTFDGATTWHVRDRIAGMHHTTDNTTVILCRDSIHQFQGASASGSDPFSLSTITNRGGAKDYSSVELGDIYFLTSSGLSSVGATDKFGNFEAGSLSRKINEWLRDRLLQNNDEGGGVAATGFLEAIPVKSKNQIRYYFNDGLILTASFSEQGQEPAFTFQHYGARWLGALGVEGGSDRDAFRSYLLQYNPTALHSSFTSWGEERMYFGLKNGYSEVARLDQGALVLQGLDRATQQGMVAYAELNPIIFGSVYDGPVQLESIDVLYDAGAKQDLSVFLGVDFESPEITGYITGRTPPYEISSNSTASSDPQFTGTRVPFIATSHLNNYSIAHSVALVHSTTYSGYKHPLRIIGLQANVQRRLPNARAQSGVELGTSTTLVR